MADPREDVANAQTIRSGAVGNDNLLEVNENGSINTIPSLPIAPASATAVVIEGFDDIGDVTGDDTFYTIVSGETLTIQQLAAGAEDEAGGSIIELFHDPDADLGVNLSRISTLFVNGNSASVPVIQSFIGDGTARIVLRRRTYTGSAREVFAQWIGFTE